MQQEQASNVADSDANRIVVTEANFPSHVQVRFVTNTYPKQTPDAPFKVPSNLTRLGLSEIVNHVLENETPVPFEFLIDYKDKKVFLRHSIAKFFIKTQQWPEEQVITLEYIEAHPAPKLVDTIPHDDWVAAMDTIDDLVVTGCYDGLCRVIRNGKVFASVKHQKTAGPVRSVSVTKRDNDELFMCTATNDQHIRLWNLKGDSFVIAGAMKGHTDAVNCVDFNPIGNMAVSGANDKTIKLWDVFNESSAPQAVDDDIEPQAKRQKTTPFNPRAIGTLQGHFLPVSSVLWSEKGVVISASKDHTIRIWDVSQATNVNTIQGSKIISSMTYSPKNNTILTAHPDFLVRMWDSRMKQGKASVFRSHKGWVRTVEWNVNGNEYQFASGADDNLVKLWDVRSAIPLHSVPHFVLPADKNAEEAKQALPSPHKLEHHKVLTCKWHAQEFTHLYTGSTDCTVKRHAF